MKKTALIFALAAMLVAMPVLAQTMSEQHLSKGIIWMNFPLMYAIDIIILGSAIFAIYIGQRMLSGELKSSFMYIFIGMMLIALHYLLDLYAMLTNNMAMMTFVYMDLFWVLNVMAFILFVIGFYKMNALFKKIAKSHLNESKSK
jgi:hypothetical protein